eukprot:2841639-Rhodomonas_salina.1
MRGGGSTRCAASGTDLAHTRVCTEARCAASGTDLMHTCVVHSGWCEREGCGCCWRCCWGRRTRAKR